MPVQPAAVQQIPSVGSGGHGGQEDPTAMVGSEEDGPGLWCRARSLPEAGGRCNSWPAAEDRVTRIRFWPAAAAMWWGVNSFFSFPCLLLCCCSYRLLVRREKTGKTPAVVRHPAAAADRVTPIWTAGGWRTGLPTGGLAGVGQGRSGHGQTARPLATTAGGRRSGSPLVGRPAGLCQGRPLRSGPPLGPTTF